MFWTDTLPIQGKGLMVQRAEKCPYCDSYFLKNSSDFQQHIWAHQGLITLCSLKLATRTQHKSSAHVGEHLCTEFYCIVIFESWVTICPSSSWPSSRRMKQTANTHADVVEGNWPISQVTLKMMKTKTSKIVHVWCWQKKHFNGYFSFALVSAAGLFVLQMFFLKVNEIAKITLRLRNMSLLGWSCLIYTACSYLL